MDDLSNRKFQKFVAVFGRRNGFQYILIKKLSRNTLVKFQLIKRKISNDVAETTKKHSAIQPIREMVFELADLDIQRAHLSNAGLRYVL